MKGVAPPDRAVARLSMMGAKQVMVFPFTVPVDGEGQMRDAAQGVYARSLARTLAERLSVGPDVSATAATLTADGLEGRAQDHGWVVASHPWTLEEACAVGLPEGTEYLLHGAAELTDRVRLRLILVDQKERRTARSRRRWGSSCPPRSGPPRTSRRTSRTCAGATSPRRTRWASASSIRRRASIRTWRPPSGTPASPTRRTGCSRWPWTSRWAARGRRPRRAPAARSCCSSIPPR